MLHFREKTQAKVVAVSGMLPELRQTFVQVGMFRFQNEKPKNHAVQ